MKRRDFFSTTVASLIALPTVAKYLGAQTAPMRHLSSELMPDGLFSPADTRSRVQFRMPTRAMPPLQLDQPELALRQEKDMISFEGAIGGQPSIATSRHQKASRTEAAAACAPKTSQTQIPLPYPWLAVAKVCQLWPNNFPTVSTGFLVGDDQATYLLGEENIAFYSPYGGMVQRFWALPGLVGNYLPVGLLNGTYAWWFRHGRSRWAVVKLDRAVTKLTGSFGYAPFAGMNGDACGGAGEVMTAEYPLLEDGNGCDGCTMYTATPSLLESGVEEGNLGLQFNDAGLGGPVFRMRQGKAVAGGTMANRLGEPGECVTRYEAVTKELAMAFDDVILNHR